MKNKFFFIVIGVTVLCFPNVNFGQTPDLGAVSSFALFTAVGAFNNTGSATYVTGDAGTNVGAFNAFPSGTVIGQIEVEDSTSLQAATDVVVAYDYLFAMTCGAVIGTTLGNNEVLTSNVYCLGAASTLNGDLILDGQNDPDALFIFQIDGAFSTSTFSNVILINSASLCNVFWQINGAVALGASSVFKGTIIANGALSLLESSSLEGRGLSRAGAISLHNNRVSMCSQSGNPLPMELLSFDACPSGMNVDLSWSTASESNNDYFTVLCSKDRISFKEVLRMNGAGNSNSVLHYSAINYDPYAGTSYYQLKQTDFDGKFTYSHLVAVDFNKSFGFNIYPNPFNTSAIVTLNGIQQSDKVELRMNNILGREIMNTILTKQVTIIETGNLPSGIYFYKVIVNDKTIQSGKLISQQ